MDKRRITLVALALSLLLSALLLLSYLILSTKKVEMVEVLVAKETIYPRQQITEKNTTTLKLPKSLILDNVLYRKEDIIGKYIQIYSLVPKDSLFYRNMLESRENLSDYPALLLKKGQVSYSLVSDVVKSSGNSLVVGQKVDLYVSIPRKDQVPITDCLVKAVRITAVKDRNGVDLAKEGSSKIPYVITVAIDETIVKYLKAATKLGTVELFPVNTIYAQNEESLLQADSSLLTLLVG